MVDKSQSSFEFLVIFGIGFSITLVMSGLFFGFFNSEKNTLDNQYIQSIGQDIMIKIEQIYFLGDGNKITMKIQFPEEITNITIFHMNNFTLPSGAKTYFDYFNITYDNNGVESYEIFEASEPYIRFNCSRCYHDYVKNISWYNESDISKGFKVFRLESQGDYVDIDFILE